MESVIQSEIVGENTVITMVLPNSAMQMFAYAAQAYGWTAKIPDGKGGLVDNPISILEKVFIYTIENVKMNAINMAAQLAAEEARKQKAIEMEAIADSILALLTR